MARPICHYVNSDTGGLAGYAQQLASAQAELGGARVSVVGPAGLTLHPAVRHLLYRPDRRVWGMNQWRFAAATWPRAAAQSLSRAALVHSHSYILARPDVHTVNGYYRKYWESAQASARPAGFKALQYQLLSRLERRVLASARAVVFVSSQNRDYAEGALKLRRPGRFHVMTPGVDTQRYRPRLRESLRQNRAALVPEADAAHRWLLFVGHDFAGKGLLRLLDSLLRVVSDQPWTLLAAGDDAHNLPAAQAMARVAPAGRVLLLGRDSRLPDLYALSDVLVMDSISEGFPLVLLEAMASGCVPVVSRFGGVADVIVDGQNGLVLPDAPAIVQAALALPTEKLRGMAEAAVRAAQARSWRAVAQEYAALYASL